MHQFHDIGVRTSDGDAQKGERRSVFFFEKKNQKTFIR